MRDALPLPRVLLVLVVLVSLVEFVVAVVVFVVVAVVIDGKELRFSIIVRSREYSDGMILAKTFDSLFQEYFDGCGFERKIL